MVEVLTPESSIAFKPRARTDEACLRCHETQRAAASLPYHYPIRKGKMTCVDCHDPYGGATGGNLENSKLCNFPAFNGRNYCYSTSTFDGRRLKTARVRRYGDSPRLTCPSPRTCTPMQVALAEIMWALAEDHIDTRRGGLILYMLQQDSTNLNRTPGWEASAKPFPLSRSQFREPLRPPAEHRPQRRCRTHSL